MVADEGVRPDIDVIRARWRRWREGEQLLDPRSDEFARGGLARLIEDRAPRLLILPADPDLHLVDLDDELWEWWGSEYEDPASGGRTNWGATKRPAAGAAVFGTDYGQGGWSRYLALHRNGGLEVGFGRDGTFVHRDRRYFLLATLVGRSWAAFARYGDVAMRFDLVSPFEITLALPDTAGAGLGRFAEGWAEPGQGFERDECHEPNVLIRRELMNWPENADGARALAFGFGAQIEDAFGVQQRRFLAYRGEHEGKFDPRSARWD
jgi:hypothetical protein